MESIVVELGVEVFVMSGEFVGLCYEYDDVYLFGEEQVDDRVQGGEVLGELFDIVSFVFWI